MEKTVYRKIDGAAIVLDNSDKCPISGQWLIPGGCTEVKPPEISEGYKVGFNGIEWVVSETEKEIERKNIEKAKSEIQELREEIERLRTELKEIKSGTQE